MLAMQPASPPSPCFPILPLQASLVFLPVHALVCFIAAMHSDGIASFSHGCSFQAMHGRARPTGTPVSRAYHSRGALAHLRVLPELPQRIHIIAAWARSFTLRSHITHHSHSRSHLHLYLHLRACHATCHRHSSSSSSSLPLPCILVLLFSAPPWSHPTRSNQSIDRARSHHRITAHSTEAERSGALNLALARALLNSIALAFALALACSAHLCVSSWTAHLCVLSHPASPVVASRLSSTQHVARAHRLYPSHVDMHMPCCGGDGATIAASRRRHDSHGNKQQPSLATATASSTAATGCIFPTRLFSRLFRHGSCPWLTHTCSHHHVMLLSSTHACLSHPHTPPRLISAHVNSHVAVPTPSHQQHPP